GHNLYLSNSAFGRDDFALTSPFPAILCECTLLDDIESPVAHIGYQLNVNRPHIRFAGRVRVRLRPVTSRREVQHSPAPWVAQDDGILPGIEQRGLYLV